MAKSTLRWLSPEEYARERNVPLPLVKRMLWPNCGRSPLRFDERDVDRRHGKKAIRILTTEPDATGRSRPRVVERAPRPAPERAAA